MRSSRIRTSRTPARKRFARERRKAPPPPDAGGKDRALALFELLLPTLPAELVALYESDRLVVGEIGTRHPAVRTRIVEPGQYVIEFSTGMMLYTELVGRYCGGLFIEGLSGSTPASFEDVEAFYQEAMRTYVDQTRALFSFWQKTFVERAIEIPPSAAKLRDGIVACARVFLLAHELGHVALEERIRARSDGNEEVAADRLGLEFGLAPLSHLHSLHVAIAGAGFAIRLLVSLQRFGLELGTQYPEQAVRLQLLDDRVRAIIGTQQRADESTTVMVAILDMLDHIDDRVAGAAGTPSYTVARARVGMLSRLVEVMRVRLTVPGFVNSIAIYEASLSKEAFADAYAALCEYYWEATALAGHFVRPEAIEAWTTLEKREYVSMGFAVRAATAALPEALRNTLPEKYRLPPPAGP